MINKKPSTLRAALAAALILTALTLIGGPAAVPSLSIEVQQKDLFVEKGEKKSVLTQSQAAIVEKIKKESTTAEVRVVEVRTGLLTPSPSNLKFNIKSDKQFDLLTAEVRQIIGGFTWLGEAKAPSDDAVFVVKGGNVTGTIRTGKELYSIRPIGGGLHALILQGANKFPPDHPPEFERREKEPAEKPDLTTKDEVPNAVRTLRVLVAYTPNVAAAYTDVGSLIDLAIAETNLSYTNSKVNIRAQLAHAYQVDYKESGNQDTDVANFLGREDSFMNEVHELRDTHKADVCVLLIDDDSYCGTADKIMATEDRAFAVVHHTCATGNYSFGHEIGHLQGARHNIEVDKGTPFDYGHGCYNEAGKWRTIMSYDCPEKDCIRIPYWSNPTLKYKESALGTEAVCNDSRVLNETALIVTSFRK